MKSLRQMMVFMPLVMILIGQFCCEVIGIHDMMLSTARCLNSSGTYFNVVDKLQVSEITNSSECLEQSK